MPTIESIESIETIEPSTDSKAALRLTTESAKVLIIYIPDYSQP